MPERKRAGRFTEPVLPAQQIAKQGPLEIKHFFGATHEHRRDHGPPHVHIIEEHRTVTVVGQNGWSVKGHSSLSPPQRSFVLANLKLVRKAIKAIGRWNRYLELDKYHPEI